MTTARKLIYDGLREGNIIPANAALTATDVQNAELLPLLNGWLFDLVGEVIGEQPRDWAVPPRVTASETPNWNTDPRQLQRTARAVPYSDAFPYPPPNSRLVVSITENTTVYLPPAPDDGALISITDLNSTAVLTIDANGRFIDDAATLTLDPVSSYNGATFMYRADQGNWRRLDAMEIDGSSPLPDVFDQLLSLGLYLQAAARYGSTPSQTTMMTFNKKLAKLRKRYRQRQPIIAPEEYPRESTQEYSGIFLKAR